MTSHHFGRSHQLSSTQMTHFEIKSIHVVLQIENSRTTIMQPWWYAPERHDHITSLILLCFTLLATCIFSFSFWLSVTYLSTIMLEYMKQSCICGFDVFRARAQVFSRGHATLHLAVSVGLSVRPFTRHLVGNIFELSFSFLWSQCLCKGGFF